MNRPARIVAVCLLALSASWLLHIADAGAQTREKHEVLADGHPITVWAKRPESGMRGVLVLVHGRRWSSLPNFDLRVHGESRSLMDAFVGKGYGVYAIDLRGYGGTPRDATGWLSPAQAALDVATVVDWVANRERAAFTSAKWRPVLLGYSRGAAVAMLCAQKYSEALSAVILNGFPYDVEALPEARPDPELPPRVVNTETDAAEDFITPTAISEAGILAYVRAALAADPIAVDWRRLHEFRSLDPARLQVPVLVLDGVRDPYARRAAHEKLFSRIAAAHR